MDWIGAPYPRRARWRAQGVSVELTDRGELIMVEVRLDGHVDPFHLYVVRRDILGRHYYVQDFAGNGYSNIANWGLGAGVLLANTAIQYLQAVKDPRYPEVRGEVYDTSNEPPGHQEIRREFFRSFGARVDGNKVSAEVHALRPRPGRPIVVQAPDIVPLGDFVAF